MLLRIFQLLLHCQNDSLECAQAQVIALINPPEGKWKPGRQCERAGCPEAMLSRSFCLSFVSKGGLKGKRRHAGKRMDMRGDAQEQRRATQLRSIQYQDKDFRLTRGFAPNLTPMDIFKTDSSPRCLHENTSNLSISQGMMIHSTLNNQKCKRPKLFSLFIIVSTGVKLAKIMVWGSKSN